MALTLFKNSAMPNSPSDTVTSSSPSDSSNWPKVKRSLPVFTSVPTRLSRMPSIVIDTPFTAEPFAKVAPASRPSSISVEISCGPKLNAMRAM